MAGISRDEVYSDLRRHIRPLWDSMTDGFEHYRKNYPDLELHRASTRASIVIDLIFARVISAFDEVPGTRILHLPNHLRLLSVSDRVTLWFKKMDGLRQTANYPTAEAIKRDGGQTGLFEQADIIVAGYILNDDETAISRISFTPPNLVKPHWYIDVAQMAQPIRMKGPVPIKAPKVRLKIDLGPDQSTMLA